MKTITIIDGMIAVAQTLAKTDENQANCQPAYFRGRIEALQQLRSILQDEIAKAPKPTSIPDRKPNRIHLAPRKQLVDLASDYINHEYPRPVDGHIALENVNSCDKHHITDWRNRKYPHSQDLRHEYYVGIDDKKLERLIKDVEREAKRKRTAAQGAAR